MTGVAVAGSGAAISEDTPLLVAERFVSVQGEGPLTGRRCAFLRLSRCNLTCTWCDTPFTWDWSRFDPSATASRVPVADVSQWIADVGVDLLVVTGGEPLLQQQALAALLARLPDAVDVQVETNGTRTPEEAVLARVGLWVVSPKLANSGVALNRRIVPDALLALRASGRAAFKFVVICAEVDIPEVAGLAGRYGLAPVWLMPEGTSVDAVVAGTAELLGPVMEHGWNLSTRLHVLAGAR